MNDIDEICGRLSGETVLLGPGTKEVLYDTSFFGRPRDSGLELTLVEAAYLIYKGRINVTSDGRELDLKAFMRLASLGTGIFEVKYIVYKDLRERGYFVQPGITDFRVYPRGGRPGKTPSRYFLYVLSERQPMPLMDIFRHITTADNVRKELVMAVVDEESDITFYGVNLRSMNGEMGKMEEKAVILTTFLGDRVMVWDGDASARLHQRYFYGKPLDEVRLQLSLIEAAYLKRKNIIDIEDHEGAGIFSSGEFEKRALSVDPDLMKKLAVYSDLRDSGMVVKTGYKFGTHYRVYKKVEGPNGMKHSEFLVHTIDSDHVFDLSQLSRAVRLAHSVNKQMVFAWQADGGIRYMEIGRVKM